jgi:hypothetical protein
VVVPFENTEEEEFIMLDPIEARSADSARFKARLLADAGKGGVAFSRTGDPDLGDYREGELLVALGSLPGNLDEYLSGSVRNYVCWRAVKLYAAMALMKRSPKRMANWAFAIAHSRGGIFHSFSVRFKTR